MKLLLITMLMSAFSCHDLQAQSLKLAKTNGEATHLIHLKGEDQYGNEAIFAPPEEKPLLIFFLPKTESRTEAEALMDEVTAWFENMDGHSGSSVSKVLVVEPYRTGPLVNRLFRSKLKDKPFQVIRDPEGVMVRMVRENRYSILLWLTDRKGNIVYESPEPFSESEFQKIRGLAGSNAVQN
ncbi:MAG: hypothetical protein JJU37_09900 [Balneolaceae bacterium]|nr:hypothetical protein [Balneolaceae bacterium]